MDIIVSHHFTDLDGLGAMIAAHALYPEAKPVFTGRIDKLVRNFMALYRDEFEILKISEINLSNINRIIIVDTHSRHMLGKLEDKLNWNEVEVILYDHHSHQELDWVNLDLSQMIGSATSIIVNKIIAENIRLNPLEATVCALGIYADTGNLTYLSTTADDLRALAFLFDSKANLKIINQFLKESLNTEQKKVLDKLLLSREDIEINGIRISLFYKEYEEYITGLNNVAEKIKTLYQIPSLFLIISMGEKVEIIGRSDDEAVNIGKICNLLGGGGHNGAGAAQLKVELKEAKENLKDIIYNNVEPLLTVRDIMSSPVRTIKPDTSISEAEKFLEKYGHNGVVICDKGKIAGIFSRRDLDKVKGHNLMQAPVKGYMSRDVIKVDADARIQQAQEIMVRYNIGRLPVLNEKKLTGIITRSDILKSYYKQETPHQFKNRYGSSLVNIKVEKISIRNDLKKIPKNIYNILEMAGKVAEENKNNLYLIGGMVRDLLSAKKSNDLDFVVEGNLHLFLKQMAQKINGEYSYNEQFYTGNIKCSDINLNLDFAQTRSEKYPGPGALPVVERSNLLEDLFRRDFTVNALAVSLNPEQFGLLLDYFQGRMDLNSGLLRALHRFSFLDDPTRIIRGVRFAIDSGFDFEEETYNLMREALLLGDFSELTTSRVFKELKLLMNIEMIDNAFAILKKLPVFKLLDINFTLTKNKIDKYKVLNGYLASLNKKNYNIKEWLLRMAIFLDNLPYVMLAKWNISKDEEKIFNFSIDKYNIDLLKNNDPAKIYKYLKNKSIEELLMILINTKDMNVKENIVYFLQKLNYLKLEINGNDLKKIGVTPGPAMKNILNIIHRAKLRGEIFNRDDELKLARKIISEKNWSEKNWKGEK